MSDKDTSHLLLELQSSRTTAQKLAQENEKLLLAITEWSQRCNELFLENEKMKTELYKLRDMESIRINSLGSHWANPDV